MRCVRGVARLASDARAQEGALLHLRLMDTTLADAGAKEVARLTIQVTDWSNLEGVPFTLCAPEVESNRRYEVHGHLDVAGDGEFAAGDAITKIAHPVLTDGHPEFVELELDPI